MMSKADSLMWDNDPHALPKTKKSKLRAMSMTYSWWESRGLEVGTELEKLLSKGYPLAYGEWLAAKNAAKS